MCDLPSVAASVARSLATARQAEEVTQEALSRDVPSVVPLGVELNAEHDPIDTLDCLDRGV